MSLDRLKPAWQQLKVSHSFDRMPHQEVLALIADQPSVNKHRSLMVNIMMLVAFLMVCY